MSHYSPLIAALVTMLLTTILLYSKAGKSVQNIPNEHSPRDIPVPHVGGVALTAGILSGWALMFNSLSWWILLPLVLLFIVSLVNDVQGLVGKKRLLARIAAAFILILGSGLLTGSPFLGIFVLLAVVWTTDLFCLVDGSDGLSGGVAFLGFSMYGVALLMHGEDTQAMLNFAISAAALGFLFNNFYPAKASMGDAGSTPLGFLAAAMGLWGWQHDCWPAWFPLLVFSPVVADVAVTLIKRGVRRRRTLEAHCEYYYQRLVRLSGARNTAMFEYVLMLSVGGCALWALRNPDVLPAIAVGWILIYGLGMASLDYWWRKAAANHRKDLPCRINTP